MQELAPPPQSSVLGRRERVDMASAALLNGITSHTFDFDDTHHASLEPLPPGGSKHKQVRYVDIRRDDKLDETQFVSWVKQANRLPGERM